MSDLFNYMHEKKIDTRCLLLSGKKYGKCISRYISIPNVYMGKIKTYYDGEAYLLMSYFTNNNEKIQFSSVSTNNYTVDLITDEISMYRDVYKVCYVYPKFICIEDNMYNVLLFHQYHITSNISISCLWVNTMTKKSRLVRKNNI